MKGFEESSPGDLIAENTVLRARLAEVEETLRAIRCGEVDALFVATSEGDQIFTLKGAEHPYRVLVETMNEGAVTAGEDGTILYCNHRFAEMVGTNPQKIIGSSLFQFIAPEDRQFCVATWTHPNPAYCRGVVSLLCGDGKHLPTLYSLSPTEIEGLSGGAVIFTDLTGQKQIEEIAAAEKLSRSILEQVSEAIVVCDREGTIILASRMAHELAGFNPVLEPVERAYPCLEEFTASIGAHPRYEEETTQREEIVFRRHDGREFDLLYSTNRIRDESGNNLGQIISLTDITAIKKAEWALRKSEESLNLALNAAKTEIWDYIFATGKIIFNRFFRDILGYGEASELTYESLVQFIHPDDRALLMKLRQERTLGKTDIDAKFRIKDADGTWRWIHQRGEAVEWDEDGNATRLTGVLMDVTDQVRLEQQAAIEQDLTTRLSTISSLEEALQACLDASMEISGMDCGGIILLDAQSGGVNLMHTTGLSVAFLQKEQQEKPDMSRVLERMSGMPQYLHCTQFEERLQQLFRDEGLRGFALIPLISDGEVFGCIRLGSHTLDEVPVYNRRALEKMAAVVSQIIVRIIIQEKLHDRNVALKRANRNLNLLSSITRHDILNQISAQKAFLALMEEHVPADAEIRSFYHHLVDTADTIRRQITFTGDYQHMGEKDPEWQNIEYAIKRAAESVHLNGIRLVVDPGLPELFADTMVEKAFFNLLENSVRHGGNVSEITVSWEPVGNNGILTVGDDGDGVAANNKELIFERGVGRNTGLGLFLAKEILNLTGIGISERGEEGKGALFQLEVPPGIWRSREGFPDGSYLPQFS